MARTFRADDKEHIIDHIEEESREGEAFDDDVVQVLKKITSADLFKLQRAFHQTYKIGVRVGKDEQ